MKCGFPRTLRATGLTILRFLVCAIAVLAFTPSAALAQMAVSGRVTVSDRPIQGATVGIPSLQIETRTSADGSYIFLVRSAQVSGQTVELVARHRQFGSRSARIALLGKDLVHNFALASDRQVANRPDTSGATTAPAARRAAVATRASRRTVDSSAFAEAPGPVDVPGVLAGRIPGLNVSGGDAFGGTSLMVYRGARSLSGSIQPLIVVDGVPLEGASPPSGPAQQFGLGGFDYGSPLQDLALGDIASVTLLDAAQAAPLYGSRAANGVLAITTKRAGGDGLQYATRIRFGGQRAARLPSYQNSFGQGLGGQFEFFDGEGGGINDGVQQSWGPALDGRPLAQASLTEPGRPDVRHWLPRSNAAGDYLDGGNDIDANATVQAVRGAHRGRASITASSVSGVAPGSALQRLGAALSGSTQPSSRLSATGNLQVISKTAEHRPGTGFDEINPLSGFTRMGRQVDLDALRLSRRDDAGAQINWIYTGRNNPFFQPLENSNEDKSSHVIGGTSVTLALTPRLSATAHVGLDRIEGRRGFEVGQGWIGGYPTALGRSDFRGGGAQEQELSSSDLLTGVSLDAVSRVSGLDAAATAGFEVRKNKFESNTSVTMGSFDGLPGGVAVADQSGSHDVNAFYLTGQLTRGSALAVNAGARVEQSASFSDALGQAIFPSLSISYDVAQSASALQNIGLGTARLRASWWRAGNELTTGTLARVFAGGGTAASPTLGLPAMDLVPERTSGMEIGAELATPGSRLALDIAVYRERASEVLIGTLGGQAAEVLNSGVELQLRTSPITSVLGPRWDLTASFASNNSRVEAFSGGAAEAALGPTLWGAWLTARTGQPVGTIVGTRYLRSSDGQLLLSSGLPVSDGSSSVLGSWQPDWTASVESRVRLGGAEMALLFDARVGGEVFSATNLWGSFAGTLESTVDGRDGMTVAGLDNLTGSTNTTQVTAEEYYHALAAIHEAWVYDASYAKLREARLTYEFPLRFFPGLRSQVARVSLTGRNLLTFAKAPNIDPEAALSSSTFQGFEMGQLPGTKSIGFVLSITP